MGVFRGWTGGFKKGANLHRKELIALPYGAGGHLTSLYYWPFLFMKGKNSGDVALSFLRVPIKIMSQLETATNRTERHRFTNEHVHPTSTLSINNKSPNILKLRFDADKKRKYWKQSKHQRITADYGRWAYKIYLFFFCYVFSLSNLIKKTPKTPCI